MTLRTTGLEQTMIHLSISCPLNTAPVLLIELLQGAGETQSQPLIVICAIPGAILSFIMTATAASEHASGVYKLAEALSQRQ